MNSKGEKQQTPTARGSGEAYSSSATGRGPVFYTHLRAAAPPPATSCRARKKHSPSIMSKRGAGSELNRDNYEREIEREGSEEAGTWQKADEVRLA